MGCFSSSKEGIRVSISVNSSVQCWKDDVWNGKTLRLKKCKKTKQKASSSWEHHFILSSLFVPLEHLSRESLNANELNTLLLFDSVISYKVSLIKFTI